MAGQISQIKRQLKSVKSTQKLTNAMSLVSVAKLQRTKGKMSENVAYADELHQLLLDIVASGDGDFEENAYLRKREDNNPSYVVITSNSGLCGSYNMDVLKFTRSNVSKNANIVAIGTFGIRWLKNNGFNVVEEYEDLADLNPARLNKLVDTLLLEFKKNQISSINIVYSKFINSLTFRPTLFNVLPLSVEKKEAKKEILLEPSMDVALNTVIPMYISAVMYSTYLEAKTSEHAARRSAMDTANNNAEELIEHLSLTYNQARQAAITQEVTEIVAGADAA